MKKSLYTTLGVEPAAGADAIRAAYEAQMASTDPQDAVRCLALKEAWNVLGHTQRRAVYDASLREQQASQPDPRASSRQRTRPLADSTYSNARWIWVGGLVLLIAAAWMVTTRTKHAHSRVSSARVLPGTTIADGMATTQPAPTATATASTARPLTAEALFAKASANVVRIDVANASGEDVALGSGVIIEQATVITNCHVAKAGARLRVQYQDKAYDASLILADEAHDLCKLSVLGLSAPPLATVAVADVKVGQKVYAIGAPQGLDLTLSDGMVSALRHVDEGTVIQTSAPVSPGSSGGGLFNEQGMLIGIVTFQMRSGQNLNFAVPAEWIASMSSSTLPSRDRDTSRTAAASASGNSDILGTWHCFGPLTGRGMDVSFEGQNHVNGTFDGQPIDGYYTLNNRQLSLMGRVFAVEELSPSRMVLSAGQGRRLACNR
ncbi:MAG: hypothetical protein EKK47_03440 [Burkholderiales bacterium]|nr:MAG: hypothetical protein EKK47_03440 [Burkholderiales bacterium]